MPLKTQPDDTIKFLLACIDSAGTKAIDFQLVAAQFNIKPGAARMRVYRIRKSIEDTATATTSATTATTSGPAASKRKAAASIAAGGDDTDDEEDQPKSKKSKGKQREKSVSSSAVEAAEEDISGEEEGDFVAIMAKGPEDDA